ncbi:OpgC family protein [Pararhodobacter marinus]|uniref:OpgC family protein n=1 Tax=Pararhodobacter marinus TaxID=2184063 RepID=UPI0035176CBD
MSPSDTKLVRFPGAAPARRPRDPRIDAFRGVALVMIFIDHVPGNPYETLTLRNWGFSDAAESFFVMSGIAAGLAYSGRFTGEARARNGGWAAVKPMWLRAWTLYQAQILLTAWAIAIFAAGAMLFNLPELLEKINLRQVFGNTPEALIGIPLMTHQLGYVNILPAYAVLLFFAPLAILLGHWRPWALAMASVALWFAAGWWRLNLPNFPNPGGWFFNPVAWQLVFVVGLLIGMALRREQRFVPRSRVLLALAAGYLLLVVAWKYIPALGAFLNHQMARLGGLGVPFHIVSHDKTFLSLPRLLHVLSMVYVLSYFDVVRRLTAMGWAAPLRLMGRQGLLVFSAGTAMSLAFQVVMDGYGDPVWMAWVLPPLGIALSIAVAALAEWQARLPGKAQAAQAAEPAPPPGRDWMRAQQTPAE